MSFRRASAGFILPTVVIASVVLFAVLTVAVSTISGTTSSLDSRAYQNMASEAAESGLRYAESCIDVNGIVTMTWSGGTALYPSVDCAGATSCSSPDCYLSNDGKARITFKVTAEMSPSSAVVNITSVGTAELLRTDGSVWKSLDHVSKEAKNMGTGVTIKYLASTGSTANHSCAVGSDGKAYCWGANNYGQAGDGTTSFSRPTPVVVAAGAIPNGVTIQSIALGGNHSCAVGSDGKAYCWGYNSTGQLGDNTATNRSSPTAVLAGAIPGGVTIRSLSLGAQFSCALGSDSKVYCWGYNTNNQLGDGTATQRNTPVAVLAGAIPAGVTVQSLSLGSAFSCALGSDGKSYCWGRNAEGEIGDGTTTQRSQPVATLAGAMPGGVTIRSLYTGSQHTCAIGSNSVVYCWGYNAYNQLGDNTITNRTSPVAILTGAIPAGVTAQSMSLGSNHSCIFGSDNNFYCWGYNAAGELGDNTTVLKKTPVASLRGDIPAGVTIQSFMGGSDHTCVLGSDKKVYCWGSDLSGQLGDNAPNSQRNVPVAMLPGSIPAGVTLTILRLGYLHSCALGSDANVYCWGQNNKGQLGDNTTTQRNTPVLVLQGAIPNGVTLTGLFVGYSHSCAIGSDSKAYCWGDNANGQLGDGTITQRNTPVAVLQGAIPGGVTLKGLSLGAYFTCAIGSDAKAYCWGYNANNQLGDGTVTQRNTPVAVLQGSIPVGVTLKSLSSGMHFTCALGSDAKAYCWGYNTYGQLGDNTTTQRTTPVAVSQGAIPVGTSLTALGTGHYHACALGSNLKAYCWGLNSKGQLGDNTITQRNAPVAVLQGAIPVGVNLTTLTGGDSHTCALGSDAKAYCWGYNGYSQLGDNTVTQRNTPVAVLQGVIPAGVTLNSISANYYQTCVIGSDTKTYCWGYNGNGQFGDNTTTQRATPVQGAQSSLFMTTGISSLSGSANRYY